MLWGVIKYTIKVTEKNFILVRVLSQNLSTVGVNCLSPNQHSAFCLFFCVCACTMRVRVQTCTRHRTTSLSWFSSAPQWIPGNSGLRVLRVMGPMTNFLACLEWLAQIGHRP